MTKYIHITAKSKVFSSFEIIPEDKAISRLKQIRDGFVKHSKHGDNLSVTTRVINPTIPGL